MAVQIVNNGSPFAVINTASGEQAQINRFETYPVNFVRALILLSATNYGRVFGDGNPIEGAMFQKMFRSGKEVTMNILGSIDSVLGKADDCDPYPYASKMKANSQNFQICSFKAAGEICMPDLTRAFVEAEQWLGSMETRKRIPIVQNTSSGALILGHIIKAWLTVMANEVTWSMFYGTSAPHAINTSSNAAPFYASVIPPEFNPNIVNGTNKFGGFVGELCQDNLVKQMYNAANTGKPGAYYFDTSTMLTPAGAVIALQNAIARFNARWKNRALPIANRLKIWVSPIIAEMVRRFYNTNTETANQYNNLMLQLLGLGGLSTDISMLDYHYPVIPIAAWDEFDYKRGAMTQTVVGGQPVEHSRNLMVMIGFEGFAGAFTTYESEQEADMFSFKTQIPYDIDRDHIIKMTASVEFSAGLITHENNPFAFGSPATQTFS